MKIDKSALMKKAWQICKKGHKKFKGNLKMYLASSLKISWKIYLDETYRIKRQKESSKIIVALSGGKASAWCADWALKNYPKKDVILYFNDTKWEHSDLYRFIDDLSKHFNHTIYFDSDGRSPEGLFYSKNSLANDRMPFCSHELKAKRLQEFYNDGDTIIFGIGKNELHRAKRIARVYQTIAIKKKKFPTLVFPLISENISDSEIDNFLSHAKIEEPTLYKLGFKHNNCSGGCVRAGKKHWKLLYETLPEVYLKREKTEEGLRAYTGKDIHFFKDETLKHFRHRIETNQLSKFYQINNVKQTTVECVGLCHLTN